MGKDVTPLSSIMAAMLFVACAAVFLSGCPGPKGSLEQVGVVQYRYNVDEAGDVVRVVGIVRNTGEERTPPGEVVVTLRGRTGSLKGQNRCELPSLDGGEERRFALAVTTHGKVDTVDIAVMPPGAEADGAEDEQSPENAAPDEQEGE